MKSAKAEVLFRMSKLSTTDSSVKSVKCDKCNIIQSMRLYISLCELFVGSFLPETPDQLSHSTYAQVVWSN